MQLVLWLYLFRTENFSILGQIGKVVNVFWKRNKSFQQTYVQFHRRNIQNRNLRVKIRHLPWKGFQTTTAYTAPCADIFMSALES